MSPSHPIWGGWVITDWLQQIMAVLLRTSAASYISTSVWAVKECALHQRRYRTRLSVSQGNEPASHRHSEGKELTKPLKRSVVHRTREMRAYQTSSQAGSHQVPDSQGAAQLLLILYCCWNLLLGEGLVK